MDQAALVGVLEPQRCLADVVAGRCHRQRAGLLDQPGQVGALDVLHSQEVGVASLAGVVGDDDIRMSQLGGGVDLAVEAAHGSGAFQPVAADDLEGDDAVHVLVLRLEDLPHATLAKPVQQPIGADQQVLAPAVDDLVDLVRRQPAAPQHLSGQGAGVRAAGFGQTTQLFELVGI
jgi:hypothetical protein